MVNEAHLDGLQDDIDDLELLVWCDVVVFELKLLRHHGRRGSVQRRFREDVILHLLELDLVFLKKKESSFKSKVTGHQMAIMSAYPDVTVDGYELKREDLVSAERLEELDLVQQVV